MFVCVCVFVQVMEESSSPVLQNIFTSSGSSLWWILA